MPRLSRLFPVAAILVAHTPAFAADAPTYFRRGAGRGFGFLHTPALNADGFAVRKHGEIQPVGLASIRLTTIESGRRLVAGQLMLMPRHSDGRAAPTGYRESHLVLPGLCSNAILDALTHAPKNISLVTALGFTMLYLSEMAVRDQQHISDGPQSQGVSSVELTRRSGAPDREEYLPAHEALATFNQRLVEVTREELGLMIDSNGLPILP